MNVRALATIDSAVVPIFAACAALTFGSPPVNATVDAPKLNLSVALTSQQACRQPHSETAFWDYLNLTLTYTNVGTEPVTIFAESDLIGYYAVGRSPEDLRNGIFEWEMMDGIGGMLSVNKATPQPKPGVRHVRGFRTTLL